MKDEIGKSSKKRNWKEEFRFYERIIQRIEGCERNDFGGKKVNVLIDKAGAKEI